MAALTVEHDNISAALRGAIAAGQAHEAMRLAAVAGWYWFLGGHKAEGTALTVAAVSLPGEVSDEVRAMAYLVMTVLVTSRPGSDQDDSPLRRRGRGR